MDIVGGRKFIDVPGDRTHELPPLFVRTDPEVKNLDKMMDVAADIIEQEDMVPAVAIDRMVPEQIVERRKLDLALNLVDQYLGLLKHWHWGDAIIEWIRQCEITFEERRELRHLQKRSLAACRSQQFCCFARRQRRSDRRHSARESRRSETCVPANAAHSLLHRSVFVLLEQYGGGIRLSNLARAHAGPRRLFAARAL